MAIGAHLYSGKLYGGAGHVKIYHINSGTWTQVGQDIEGDKVGANIGWKVSLSGDGNTVAIGSPNYSLYGLLRVYHNQSGAWLQKGTDIIGKTISEKSGYSVALSADGTTVASGTPWLQGNLSSGVVRVYDLKSATSSNNFVLDNFNIYPNPATNILNVSLENNLKLEKVIIFNNLGQIVKVSKYNTIDTSALSTGIYIVEVSTNQGKASKKLIIE
ncbi:MAG TPA: T9SS type A sorting domain-containing protein [Flavobacterium sp.]|nr:T9SS type A sorting domain-containing protein [Flavobacterium sp.]